MATTTWTMTAGGLLVPGVCTTRSEVRLKSLRGRRVCGTAVPRESPLAQTTEPLPYAELAVGWVTEAGAVGVNTKRLSFPDLRDLKNVWDAFQEQDPRALMVRFWWQKKPSYPAAIGGLFAPRYTVNMDARGTITLLQELAPPVAYMSLSQPHNTVTTIPDQDGSGGHTVITTSANAPVRMVQVVL